MILKKYLMMIGLILTPISAYADEPGLTGQPIAADTQNTHPMRFLWMGLDWETVSQASVIIWISENCEDGIAKDQVKKAQSIINATKSHPRAADARSFVLYEIGISREKDACAQLNKIVEAQGPF